MILASSWFNRLKNGILFMTLIILVQIKCQNREQPQKDEDLPFSVVQQIDNKIVEEYETLTLQLSNYFSGSLMDYKIVIDDFNQTYKDQNEKLLVQKQLSKTIYLNQNWENFAFKFMPEGDCQDIKDPFPRSTIMLDDDKGLLKLYLIDRYFNFVSYCFENYLQNVINERQVTRLDTTLLNGTCTDIKHIQINNDGQYLIIFCISSYTFNETTSNISQAIEPKTINYVTIVQIRNYEDEKSEIKYYTQDFQKLPIDFRYPVRFVGNFTQIHINNEVKQGAFGLFLANLVPDDALPEIQDDIIPQFFWIDFTLFQEMGLQNETKRYDPIGKLLFPSVKLNLTTHLNELRIIDYKAIFKKEDEVPEEYLHLFLALVIEAQGSIICEIFNYKESVFAQQNLNCVLNENAFFNYDSSALAVHYEPDHPDSKLYLVSAYPAKVTEFDITDFANNYITKIYQSSFSANKRYLGQAQIAVNQYQILHLLRDIYTGQYVIRSFVRDASFFRIVLYDLQLSPFARSSFFAFPNYYFSKMLYRDERTVNITQIFQHHLKIDRSEKILHENQDLLNNRTFGVTIYEDSRKNFYLDSFNVTFIDKYNTTIFLLKSLKNNINVLYSCGDSKFQYDLSKIFDGPDYRLNFKNSSIESKDAQSDDELVSYFSFSSSREKILMDKDLTGVNCQKSLIVPSVIGKKFEPDILVLICFNLDDGIIKSYRIPTNYSSLDDSKDFKMPVVNEVKIPFSKIIQYQYDSKQRVIIALVKVIDPISKRILNNEMEVHYFQIEGCITWRRKHPILVENFVFTETEDFFGYCPEHQAGIFIRNGVPDPIDPLIVNASFLIFRVDFVNFNLINLKPYTFQSKDGNITKAMVLNENLFLTLTQSHKILFMQLYPEAVKIVNSHESPNKQRYIIDLDFIDSKYLVIYHNDSVTDVYEPINSFEILHKMRLPLYQKYENFTYVMTPKQEQPQRDYFEGTLVLFMNSTELNQTAFFVYKLSEQQHNSLYIVNTSFQFFFENSQHEWVVLTGNSDDSSKHYLGLVSDKNFMLVELRYTDKMRVNKNKNKALVDSCKDYIKAFIHDQDLQNQTQKISDIIIEPYSEVSYNQQKSEFDYVANISVLTKNLGLAILSQPEQQFHVQYSSDNKKTKSQFIMTDGIIEGYNMKFNISCVYNDSESLQYSCDEALNPQVKTTQQDFPIDFVTSERLVHQSFPIDKYFFILDSQGSIFIMSLPSQYDPNYNGGENIPLKKIARLNQTFELGCQLLNSSYFAYMHRINQTDYEDRSIFLFFYQCIIDGSRQLSAIEIAVYKDKECDETDFSQSCIELKRFRSATNIVYDIIDVELVNLTYSLSYQQNNQTNKSSRFGDSFTSSAYSYKADLAIVCKIDESYTNTLIIYSMSLNGSVNGDPTQKKFDNMTLVKFNSASLIKWDIFKPNRVSEIPNTRLMVVSVDYYGALIYHTGKNEIIYKINLTEYDSLEYINQMKDQIPQLRVFGVKTNLPYQIQVFSNMGIYNIAFNESIDNEEFFLKNKDLKPRSWRIFRLPFVVESAEIVKGPYGYAMLAVAPTGRKSFTVKLVALTHYSNNLSKLFRVVDVIQNENCTSLNRNPTLEASVQDQLALSFICESRLYITRICLRPNVEIDFQKIAYLDDSENKAQKIPRLQYNKYQLMITATNDFTQGDVNKVTVPLEISYQLLPAERTDIITFTIVTLTVFTAMFLFLFLRSRMGKQQEDEEILRTFIQQENIRQSRYVRHSSRGMKKRVKFIDSEYQENLQSLETENIFNQDEKEDSESFIENSSYKDKNQQPLENNDLRYSNKNMGDLSMDFEKASRKNSKREQIIYQTINNSTMGEESFINESTSFQN